MLNFEWHPGKAASNLRKHRVDFNVAATVFMDRLASTVRDDDHSESEERWVTIGETPQGQLLVVCHTSSQVGDRTTIRIISARRATRNEQRQYKSGK